MGWGVGGGCLKVWRRLQGHRGRSAATAPSDVGGGNAADVVSELLSCIRLQNPPTLEITTVSRGEKSIHILSKGKCVKNTLW